MKKAALILVLIYFFQQLMAQSNLEDYFQLNFAVPNSPAFNIMDYTPSEILRPSDLKTLTIMTFSSNSKQYNILPNDFAIEFAPSLMFSKQKYFERNKTLNSLRISLGKVTINENGISQTKFGIGARISLLHDGDPKLDDKYIEKFNQMTQEFEKINKEELNAQKSMEVYYKKMILNEKIIQEKELFEEEYWNAKKLDIAIALLEVSPDSLLINIKKNKFATWITFAYPIKSWGQILIGGNTSYFFKPENYFSTSLSSRFYAGTNRYKFFIETQYKYIFGDNSNNILINSGGEFGVLKGVWLVFNFGKNFSQTNQYLVANLNLRMAIPEAIKN